MRKYIALCLTSILVASCSETIPTKPSETAGPGTTSVAAFASLSISVPSTIEPGETVQLSATARLSDGSTANYTDKVSWRTNAPEVLAISSLGQATARTSGEVQVSANPIGGGRVVSADVLVIRSGTYVLSGLLRESGFPVTGATVTVASGQGPDVSTVTDFAGSYRFYGVVGPVAIQISKPGYDLVERLVTVSSAVTLSVTEMKQSGDMASLAGDYTLTLATGADCIALPAIARSRTYAARVTQTAGALQVTLSGADFLPGRNHFSGRITSQGVTFMLGAYDPSVDLTELTVIEPLGSLGNLSYDGESDATIAPNLLSGSFTGRIGIINAIAGTPGHLEDPRFSLWCRGAQFTMTPVTPR